MALIEGALMNIEDRIKEVFSKKRVLENSKWDVDTQPNIYELERFLRKSGYRLVDVLPQQRYHSEVLIEPIKSNHLYPEITHSLEDGKFYTKIINYGMLEASDLEEIIKGYENALGVLNHLDSLDLSKLEISEE